MIPEVQTGMVRRRRNDSKCLYTERRELGAEPTELSHCASAERTVQPSKQTEEYRAAAEIVTERHVAVPVHRGQDELRGGVASSYQRRRVRHYHLLAV